MPGPTFPLSVGRVWLGARLGALARAGLDLALPPRCLTCDAGVEATGRLCAACFRLTFFVTQPCCLRCGTPFGHAGQGGLAMACAGCLAQPPPWRQGRAALRYDDQARRLILPFKYGDRVELASALARHMARAGAPLLREAEVIVPVPLHRRRLLARRYNQSALLAHAVGRLAGRVVVADALRRLHPTASLAGQTRQQRAATVAGAFDVRPARRDRLFGRRVLLVDDVLTTGATAAACTEAMLAAGAARVDLLVAARAGGGDEALP